MHTIYIVSGSSNSLVGINPQGTFEAVVNSISFREVGQDWTLGSEVTIGDNLAHFESNTNTYSYIRQDISSLTTKTYKIQLEVKNYVSGAVQVAFSGASPIAQNLNVSSDGVYTAYLTPNANGDDFEVSREFNGGNFNFDITNISVKEVGMDWTLGTGWSIGENKASCDGTNGSRISQDVGFQASKTYRFTIEVSDYTSGSIGFQYYNGGYVSFGSMADGVKTIEFTITGTDNGFLYIRSTNFIGSITNISVIEITDDTNLPRINYEGFSYQDALGSELVVNGDFSSPTTIGWSAGSPDPWA